MQLIFIFLFFLIFSSQAFAQKDFNYFSFAKYKNQYFIGLESLFYDKNKILNPNELNYEWTIFFADTTQDFKTYKPFLSFYSEKKPNSGKVKIYSNDLSFIKELNFVFSYRAKPSVSIVRYIEELNLVLPFNKIEKNEKLFPLIFNFSSNNLSFVWKVLGDSYYSLLFDPEGLPKDTEIKLIVTNLDDPSEYDSHLVKIK